MKAQVSIEENRLGAKPWAVIITRSGEPISRTLWERYSCQLEAEVGARAARIYLESRPTSLPI